MDMRYPIHPDSVKCLSTDELYHHFHIRSLFVADRLALTYTHIDRVIIGGVLPIQTGVTLSTDKALIAADYFLQRREVGIINVGGDGHVRVDGESYVMKKQDGLYIGRGTQKVQFSSDDSSHPAAFYLVSAPAHTSYPTTYIKIDDAQPLHLGDIEHSNTRTIYKYIHSDGVKSCQLVMGLTQLKPNNLWNTMPPHLHARRMEVYFYFDVADGDVVFHLMGEPGETRHLVIRNREAVISPSWSIHAGVGTGSYSFIWAMAGENQDFSDMDAVHMDSLR